MPLELANALSHEREPVLIHECSQAGIGISLLNFLTGTPKWLGGINAAINAGRRNA
ncbi:hypothetical protein KSP40_PGU004563 [Platanthera guangdongensis]|uniref:Uncharacterized protein n=1 Tax=Platanthera guangdongensis TaxID=2320717 RepID=A0ABR2N5S2_9ASPA